ncbi:hypothetical protein JX266_006397 [Neoarthrinium moseri]|uniref:uncharacterized protein n=1 Tax=Neoarthrinium moseri TaxID=1658444 RepID=UPI001FDAF067|nr:uncharacterized protein JN550_007098 [Neoarthrinium moseri]KAI1847545.1 hypothetical protein JX266_006397 [Neoarthrinium moseri]KAI1867367.1 hypothetical protein JN550_007098 [Neoarthrinium moseri]
MSDSTNQRPQSKVTPRYDMKGPSDDSPKEGREGLDTKTTPQYPSKVYRNDGKEAPTDETEAYQDGEIVREPRKADGKK